MSLRAPRILSLALLVAIAFSIVAISPAIPKAHAAAPASLSIKPSSQPLATAGSTVTFQVNVTNVPPVSGINIYVFTNSSILNPTAITVGTFVPGGIFETSHCIDNVGTGCDAHDGPGVVHESFASLSASSGSGNGTLFTVSFNAVTGPGTQVRFPEPVTSNNGLDSLFDPNGFNITGVPEQGGIYGSAAGSDFSVSAGPVSPASILATNSGTSTITVKSLNNFAGTVTLTANPSAGLACGPVPSVNIVAGGTATSTLTCGAATGADYTATVTGTGGSSTISHTTLPPATFHVVDFSTSCSGITTLATVTGSSSCSFTPVNGFTGSVAFAVSSGFVPPSGCNTSLASATLSVTCATGVAPFNVPVTGTTGTGSNTLSRTTTASVTVQDYTLSCPGINTLATKAGTSTCNVNPINGFSGSVTFAISSGFTFPTGCNGSFNGAILSVTCTTGVALFGVPVTGSSGGLSRSMTVPVTIQDFTPSCPGITTLATVAGTSTCTIAPINGFSSTVTWSVNASFVFPSGCSGSFTGAALSVKCATGIAPFNVPVIGTAGTAPNTLARGTAVSVRVQDFTVSASPISLTTAGVAGSSQITLTAINGFTGAVNYAVTSTQPAGCTATVSSAGLISVTCSPLPSASFVVTVNGTAASASTLSRAVNGAAGVTVGSNSFIVSLGTVSPTTILATNSGSSTITVTSVGSFAGTVALTPNPSTGLTCQPIPSVTLTAGSSATSTLTCTSTSGADYATTVTGLGGSPSQSHGSNTVTLHFVDFSIAGPAITTLATVAGTSTIAVTPINGFTGTVTFTIGSGFTFPTGCSGSFSGAILSVTCATGVAPFTVPVTGTTSTAPATLSRTSSLSVTVQDFSLSGPAITTLATIAGASTIAVAPVNGFSGGVTFSISSGFTFPTGCNGSFNGAVLSVTCATGVAPFSVPVTGITGTAPNTLSRSTSVPATIQDFSLSGPAITTLATIAGSSTVAVTPINGFTGSVTFAVSSGFVFPSGCSGSFSGAVLSVTCSTGVTPFTVPVTGTTGTAPNTLSRSANVSVNVQDYSIGGPAITTLATVAGTSTVVVTPINGFAGTVSFAISSGFTFPTGCSGSFSSAVLSVTCTTGVASFSVPVTGTTGTAPNTLSRSTTVSVTIQDFTPACPGITKLATIAGSSSCTVTPINGFTGTVTWSVTSGFTFPTGCGGSFSGSVLSVTCATGVAPFNVPVTGSSGGLSRSTSLTVTIQDFTVSANPASLSVVVGTPKTSALSFVAINGFTGTVTFSTSAAPTGCTASVSGTTLTVSCTSVPSPATFTLTITGTTGTSPNTLSRTAPVSVTVGTAPTFTVSLGTVSPANILATKSGSSTITVTSVNSFAGTVTLTANPSAGLSCNAPAAVTLTAGSSGTSTLTCNALTGGNYTATVTGVGGSPTLTIQSSPVTFRVVDFSVSANPSSLAVVIGTPSTSTLSSAAINGFTGTVTFSTSAAPTGCTATVSGTTLTVNCTAVPTPASFSLTITGTTGTSPNTLSRTTTVSVTVAPPTYTISLGAVSPTSILATNSGSSTITVHSLNAFAGTVTLAANPSTGLSCSTPASVTLTAGSTATSTLTCQALTGADYTATVTGSPQSIISNSVTLHVVDFSVNANPSSLSVTIGTPSTSTLSSAAINGFTGTVTFSTSAAPTGCTATVSSTTLTVSCTATPTPNPFSLTITGTTGTAPNTLSRTRTLSVSVANPTYTTSLATVSPSTILATNSASSTVTVHSLNGFSGTVTLAANPSTGLTCQPVASVTLTSGSTATSTLTCSAAVGADYSATVTGTPLSILSNSVTFHVVDFSIAGPAITTLATVSGSSTVVVTSLNGFSGTVTLAVSSGFTFPTGCSGSITSAVLSVTCATGVAPFSVPITGTTGTAPNTLSRVTSVSVTVQDFSVSANPVSLKVKIPTGGTGTNSSTLSSVAINGFAGAVTFSTSAAPTGCTASVSGTTLTVSCTSVPSPSTFTLTITGTTGTSPNTLSRTKSVSVTVVPGPDFVLTSSSSNIGPLVTAWQAADGTPQGPLIGETLITVTVINGFTGTVTLALTVPAGLTGVLNTTALTFVAGGFTRLNATLDVSSTAAANYSASVGASSTGFTSKSYNLAVTVVDFSLVANPTIGPLAPVLGQIGTSPYTITGMNGISAAFNVSMDASGLTQSVTPKSCTVTPASPTCGGTISVASPDVHGPYSITVHATTSVAVNQGTLGATRVIVDHTTVVVVHVPDFALFATPIPAASPVVPGASGTSFTVTVEVFDMFAGPVTLTGAGVSSLGLSDPSHVTASLLPNSLNFPAPSTVCLDPRGCPRFLSSTLTVTVSTLGTYNILVTGKSTGLPDRVLSPAIHVFSPALQLLIQPSSTSSSPAGSTITYNITTVSLPSYSGYNIYVKANATVLSPDSIDVSSSVIPSFFEVINCVNGGFYANGTAIPLGMPGNNGCDALDGTGIAHSAGVSATGASFTGDGLLFQIHYKSQPADYSIISAPSTIGGLAAGVPGTSTITLATNAFTNLVIMNDTVSDPNGFPIPHSFKTALYGNFTASLQLTASPGLTATLSSPNVFLDIFHNPVSAILTVNATTCGTYTVNIDAVPNASSGLLVHRATVTVLVTSNCIAFTISATPNLVYIQGSSGTSTITVTGQFGFAGSVCLTQTGASLLSPSFNPTCVTISSSAPTASSTFTFSAIAGQTPTGTYQITVSGTSGTVSHTTMVTVVVLSNALFVSPKGVSASSSVSIASGGVQTWTVSLKNRSHTTQYAMVTISVTSTSGTRQFTVQSPIITVPGNNNGNTFTVTATHTFASPDIGLTFQWTAIVQFGTSPTNLDQVDAPFHTGSFTVTA